MVVTDNAIVPSPRSSESSSDWPEAYMGFILGFAILALVFAVSCLFKRLGHYRLRKGYPYKYCFDIVPKGKTFLATGTLVFVPDQWMERMKPVRIPPGGLMAENDEPGEENLGTDCTANLEAGTNSGHPRIEMTSRRDVVA